MRKLTTKSRKSSIFSKDNASNDNVNVNAKRAVKSEKEVKLKLVSKNFMHKIVFNWLWSYLFFFISHS